MHDTSGTATPSTRAGWRPQLPPLLLLATLLGMGVLALVGMWRFFLQHEPLDPWEAAQVGEAWRAAHAMPVYEMAPGHATHMYGPLAPWLFGALVRAVGPSIFVPRLFTLVSALLIIAMIARAVNRAAPRPVAWQLAGVGLLLAIDAQTLHFFVRGKPDLVALFVASLGLAAMHHWEGSARLRTLFAASVLFVVAVFLKQSTAVLTGIPFLALLGRPPRSIRRLALSTMPAVAVALALVVVRVRFPIVHHYMIAVPATYGIDKGGMLDATLLFLGSLPLFWILGAQRILSREPDATLCDPERWIVAALTVTVPTGALFIGKLGGGTNSWLPALLVVVGFCLLQLPRVIAWLTDAPLGYARRMALSAMLSVAAVATMPSLYHNLFRVAHLQRYDDMLSTVRALPPGRVASPSDVLIALRARGEIGPSVHSEMDAGGGREGWHARIPARIVAELDSARYVVMPPDEWFTTPLRADSVAARGFTPRERVGPFTIWERYRSVQTPSTLLPSR